MPQAQLSDVQIANLTLLFTIRDALQADRLAASCRFGLDAQQSQQLTELTIQQLLAIVANVGDATLFPPRPDLVALLQAPPPLARPLAAVHTVLRQHS